MNVGPQPAGADGAIEADDFFSKSGPLPTAFDEDRRHPRFYYRARLDAAIHPLGASGQPPLACSLLARDLSRGGMNLVHSEQVYPGQRIDLVLTDGTSRAVEVMWCRRMAHRCYSIGCRFIKSAEEESDSQASGGHAAASGEAEPTAG